MTTTLCGLCGHEAKAHYATPIRNIFGGTSTAAGCNEWGCRCTGFVPEGGA